MSTGSAYNSEHIAFRDTRAVEGCFLVWVVTESGTAVGCGTCELAKAMQHFMTIYESGVVCTYKCE